MTKVRGIDSIVSQLRREKTNLAGELKQVDAALSVLGRLNGRSSIRPKRILSASARRKIAAAQRARWAKVRAAKKAA
jgi:hypothetical protein